MEHFEKKTQGQKTQAEKNSSKSFKNSIICQLKTDFLLKKVLKLLYFAQKFAQTQVLKLKIGKIQGIWEKNSILLNKLKELSEKLKEFSEKLKDFF